jgi:ferritin
MEPKVVMMLQAQANRERTNAQVYTYIADVCRFMAYEGFEKFFRKQAQDEMGHANKFYDFLASKRLMPIYDAISPIQFTGDLYSLTQMVVDREKSTTEHLKEIYEAADDPQVHALLDWFLLEQVEEENWSQDLMDQVGRTDANGWLILDEKYGQ